MRPEKISKAFNKSISASSYIPEMFFADLKFIRLTKFPQSSKGLSINSRHLSSVSVSGNREE